MTINALRNCHRYLSYYTDMVGQNQLSKMSGLTVEDQTFISQHGSGARLSVPYDTIHEAFESVVDAFPAIVAAVHGDRKITYHQLDLAANRLAHHLIGSGLRPKQRVCLVVHRSVEMLIGLLAILKAGCQYVPIDGGVASDQALQHIFEDTEARFILCLPKFWEKVQQFAPRDALVLELGMETGAFYSPLRPCIKVSGDDGVYAMYTSGKLFLNTCRVYCLQPLSRKYRCAERCGCKAHYYG